MTYSVGYKRPPVRTRFKKGKSGNPKGRPKRSRSLADEMFDLLNEKVELVVQGIKRKFTRRKLLAMKTLSNAMNGDASSAKIVNALDAMKSDSAPVQEEPLSEKDAKILDRFIRKLGKV